MQEFTSCQKRIDFELHDYISHLQEEQTQRFKIFLTRTDGEGCDHCVVILIKYPKIKHQCVKDQNLVTKAPHLKTTFDKK